MSASTSSSPVVNGIANPLHGLVDLHDPLSSFKGVHILSSSQFNREQVESLCRLADDCRHIVTTQGCCTALADKLLITLFYESSTRTSCSFQAAMLRLGGKVMTLNDTASSSVSKGETLEDTVRCLESYADIIIQRHPQVGLALKASRVLTTSTLINAGDGVGEHPTQSLLDIYTIIQETPSHAIDGLTITLVGDLKHGRTVHSLVRLLTLFNNVTINYVSPQQLTMPREIQDEVTSKSKSIKQAEFNSLETVLSSTDILYVTRVQKERFDSIDEYNSVVNQFVITPQILSDYKSKSSLRILHPLPRVNELSSQLDSDVERASYFRQMKNGMFMRMALLCTTQGRNPTHKPKI